MKGTIKNSWLYVASEYFVRVDDLLPRFTWTSAALMYRRFYAAAIYPLYHRLIRSGAVAAINELASHDKLSRHELGIVERRKLYELLAYVKKNVPYYRRLFRNSELKLDAETGASNFASLPFLSKKLIRENSDLLKSTDRSGNKLDPNSTSGSTGSPLEFHTDRRSKSFRKASVVRNRAWIGIRTGERVVHLWGSPIEKRKAESLRGRMHSAVTQEAFLSAYSASDSDFENYVTFIRSFKPKLLIGYPSILESFATYCRNNDEFLPSIEAIIASAEALYDSDRRAIENGLSATVYNRYGCREVGDIAHEVQGGNGLYVNSDRILLEIVDDNGMLCPPGQLGRILVTDLDNYGMPLIRYEIGDLGAWSTHPNDDFSLPYPVLERIEGRSLDVVQTRDGNRVGGTFWTILLRQRPGIESFQVVQDSLDGVTIRYVAIDTIESSVFDFFETKIRETCTADFEVTFEKVEKIYPEPSGKVRVVKSNIKAKAGCDEALEACDDHG